MEARNRGKAFLQPKYGSINRREAARRGHRYAWRACCTFATLESFIALSICFFAEKVALMISVWLYCQT